MKRQGHGSWVMGHGKDRVMGQGAQGTEDS